VALEEHFATEQFLEGPGRDHFQRMAAGSQRFPGGVGGLVEQLADVAAGRIAEMDAAGVNVQVLSLTAPGLEQVPGSDAVALARAINDDLADAIRHYPQRMAGFAGLPTAEPAAAADELERVVRQYHFVGALDTPLYLHPTPPPESVLGPLYAGNYPQAVSQVLATAG